MEREVEVGIDGVCQADARIEVGRDELQRQWRPRALSFAIAREVDLVTHGNEVIANQFGVALIRVGLGDIDQSCTHVMHRAGITAPVPGIEHDHALGGSACLRTTRTLRIERLRANAGACGSGVRRNWLQ